MDDEQVCGQAMWMRYKNELHFLVFEKINPFIYLAAGLERNSDSTQYIIAVERNGRLTG